VPDVFRWTLEESFKNSFGLFRRSAEFRASRCSPFAWWAASDRPLADYLLNCSTLCSSDFGDTGDAAKRPPHSIEVTIDSGGVDVQLSVHVMVSEALETVINHWR
jgi:hypothetical protein